MVISRIVPLDVVLHFSHAGGEAQLCGGVDECDRQFPNSELKASVDEASESGRAVAAHAIDKASILAALRTGARSIEHGLLVNPRELPPKAIEEIEGLVRLSRSTYGPGDRRGVKIALGTDTYSSSPEHPLAHGKNAMELRYAVKAGMTLLQAIEDCKATPPEVPGTHDPLAGAVEERAMTPTSSR
ncbi:hypothetical protein DL771_004041 [Monosporascus sp. 5C6A]|nr:hypothetical protein DL771_004041 [Monosporascus sp. 5C6A]